ncbi:ribosomal protein L34 [Chloropicon primus]|uniref:Ribosomal protein L34 n=2 Tax=Chloropicon primus TaxID=1764295 RepID=A0A5B8MNM8_9CHLO|nr:ribosomal protein L34 [Chloropicon primus]UPR01494.1 ribosomal protein L34 [Chloropicon primus]|eukprot:QDZ22278.1 ribosomal protein L34 [Chloropicon primus]
MVMRSMGATVQTRLVTGRTAVCGSVGLRRTCGATASTFVGGGAGLSAARRAVGAQTRSRGGALIVEANAKRCLGSTKGGTNRHRARTSGFRVRKRSATGSKVLKNRRKKGRKQLAPASKFSGKK